MKVVFVVSATIYGIGVYAVMFCCLIHEIITSIRNKKGKHERRNTCYSDAERE